MLKPLALLAALALAIPSTSAQTIPPPAPTAPSEARQGPHKTKAPEKIAAHRSQKMAYQLGLSPGQQARLQAALLAERPGITAATGPAPADRRAQYRAQVQAILTPAQSAQYRALQQQKRAEAKTKRRQRINLITIN